MKKRALLVGYFSSSPAGIVTVTEELACKLGEAGWSVITASSSTNKISRLLETMTAILAHAKDYDVAHVDVYADYGFLWAETACWALRLIKKPYTLTLHSGRLPHFAASRPARVRRLLKSAKIVTTPSPYLLEHMSPYGNDLKLLPNPIDVKTYLYRERVQLKPRLVWLRALHSLYNPVLALQTVALLSKDTPEVNLNMIGPTKIKEVRVELESCIRQQGLTDNVTLYGPAGKAEIPNLLNEADIFLNTTNSDNTPVTILEALASGLCIVSTNVEGLPYLLEHEHDALLVPPEDPEAMASAVRRLLAEPALAKHLSKNARAKGQCYDWSIILPQWEKMLTSISRQRNAKRVGAENE